MFEISDKIMYLQYIPFQHEKLVTNGQPEQSLLQMEVPGQLHPVLAAVTESTVVVVAVG